MHVALRIGLLGSLLGLGINLMKIQAKPDFSLRDANRLPEMKDGRMVQRPGIMLNVQARPPVSEAIQIRDTTYEGRPHFVVNTPSATYYFDKAGGGFSRLIDPEGRDWIGFKMEPWGEYPPGAASAFRGLPNAVYKSEDGGAGHPGHDLCESQTLSGNTILTSSHSGLWQWRWTFYADHARLEMLRTNPDHPYWFLYEGPVGGHFVPQKSYFGTDQGGPDTGQFDFFQGQSIYGEWQWAYFGQLDQERVLYLLQETPDTLQDTFGYLGNTEKGIESPDGMVVFGFGRAEGAQPLMHRRQAFRIGFWEKAITNRKSHKQLSRFLKKTH